MLDQPALLPAPPETDMERAVPRLLGILAGRGWMTRRKIVEIEPAWNDADGRTLRAIAEAADGKIMSWVGSPGYKLMAESTQAEKDQMNRSYLRSMKSLDHKRCALLRGWHGPAFIPAPAILPATEGAAS